MSSENRSYLVCGLIVITLFAAGIGLWSCSNPDAIVRLVSTEWLQLARLESDTAARACQYVPEVLKRR